jgi:small subunit ribosomal protein S17
MADVKAKSKKNQKVGAVVSTKMQKTIVVEVTRRVPHPLYKRIVTKRAKFYAHDESSTARLGDVVRIVECRPLSRLKRWRLDQVVRRAIQVGVEPTAADLAGVERV